MSPRWWKRLIVGVLVLALIVYVYDMVGTIRWQGRTDLEVVFCVTEAGSGTPVPGAKIEIQEPETNNKPFTLVTDSDGIARKSCPNSHTGGVQSRLRFTDSWVVRLPSWRLQVIAVGYDPSEWICLWEEKYYKQARRLGPGQAKLVVPISLRAIGSLPGQ
jgi:hypothetical protein